MIEKIKIRELTFEQCEQYHKELWTFMTETGEVDKRNWSGWDKFDEYPRNLCFACNMDNKLRRGVLLECTRCPLEWPAGLDCYTGAIDADVSLWDKWCGCETNEERKPLAQQIYDLPWKQQ